MREESGLQRDSNPRIDHDPTSGALTARPRGRKLTYTVSGRFPTDKSWKSRRLNFWKSIINKEKERNKPIKHLEIRGWTSDFREITETRMRIYAPVICPHPNYNCGDSVTMVFNHTYNMEKCLGSDFLGQYLPYQCIRRQGTKKRVAFSLVLCQRLLVGV